MKLLIVDDEPATADFLHQGLSEEGFVVDVARTAAQADEAASVNVYDAIVLDVMLPGVDGFELCRRWRERGLTAPVIFLTARDRIQDRVRGLELGEDYLVKPFSFEELVARLRARLRQGGHSAPEVLKVGPLQLEPSRRRAELNGSLLQLTAREYLLLEYLARRPGQVVSRTALWENVWESGAEPNSNVVDVYIGYLRARLGPQRSLLKTVRGAGYCLESS